MQERNISQILLDLRHKKGVTQEEVAKSLSISNKTISKWENGTSTPDLSMLVALAKYYGVTTDALLGLAEIKTHGTQETVGALFEGLEDLECIDKTFEILWNMVPLTFFALAKHWDSTKNDASMLPMEQTFDSTTQISSCSFFELLTHSSNTNIAVFLLRNKENFAWLNDPEVQKKIAMLFRFLSHEDTLAVLYFIHSTACSERFTADYITKNTGVDIARVGKILEEFCAIGACVQVTAHLAEGKVKIYESHGSGLLLSLLTLAFEQMLGDNRFAYRLNGNCKMISGGQ